MFFVCLHPDAGKRIPFYSQKSLLNCLSICLFICLSICLFTGNIGFDQLFGAARKYTTLIFIFNRTEHTFIILLIVASTRLQTWVIHYATRPHNVFELLNLSDERNSPLYHSHVLFVFRPLRPFFIVNFPESRQVRRAFRNTRNTLLDILNVLVLLLASISLFALMAVKLFKVTQFQFKQSLAVQPPTPPDPPANRLLYKLFH